MNPFEELLEEMTAFYAEREWDQFHSPKNLAICLSVEAAEILEHFRWITEEKSYQLDTKSLDEVEDEIGDVMLVLIHLSNKLGINPLEAAKKKLVKVNKRYPIDLCKGKSLKYTAYETSSDV